MTTAEKIVKIELEELSNNTRAIEALAKEVCKEYRNNYPLSLNGEKVITESLVKNVKKEIYRD